MRKLIPWPSQSKSGFLIVVVVVGFLIFFFFQIRQQKAQSTFTFDDEPNIDGHLKWSISCSFHSPILIWNCFTRLFTERCFPIVIWMKRFQEVFLMKYSSIQNSCTLKSVCNCKIVPNHMKKMNEINDKQFTQIINWIQFEFKSNLIQFHMICSSGVPCVPIFRIIYLLLVFFRLKSKLNWWITSHKDPIKFDLSLYLQ